MSSSEKEKSQIEKNYENFNEKTQRKANESSSSKQITSNPNIIINKIISPISSENLKKTKPKKLSLIKTFKHSIDEIGYKYTIKKAIGYLRMILRKKYMK